MEKKKGADIANLILNVLHEKGLDIKNCRGQGYDNGSNMAGIYKGVQALIKQKNPQGVYLPWAAHRLNLCGVHAVKSSVPAKSYFGNFQLLYSVFSKSPARWKILQELAGLSLHQTSQTRWSARIKAIKQLSKRRREIIEALKKLKDMDLTVDVK